MNQKRLAAVIWAHEEALRAHPEGSTPHQAVLSILLGLAADTITLRQALRLLSYQALQLDDTEAHQALYRQAADLQQMKCEEW